MERPGVERAKTLTSGLGMFSDVVRKMAVYMVRNIWKSKRLVLWLSPLSFVAEEALVVRLRENY
jgi:hypothetical protein